MGREKPVKNKNKLRPSVYEPDVAPVAAMEGQLEKRSHKGKWQARYVVTNGRYINYFHSRPASTAPEARPDGSLSLDDVHSIEVQPDGVMLVKLNSSNFYEFRAESEARAREWVMCLDERRAYYKELREDAGLAAQATAAAAAAGAEAAEDEVIVSAGRTRARTESFDIVNASDPYKIVLVGDAGVGKSNLLHVLSAQGYDDQLPATLSPEFVSVTVPHPSGDPRQRLAVKLWDTAGQERYRAITQSHYRRADGAMLVYDVACPSTFDSLDRWHGELMEAAADSVAAIMMVENKIDLLPCEDAVPAARPRRFSEKHGTLFVRTSAKYNATVEAMGGQKVQDAFRLLVHSILRRKEKGVTIGSVAQQTVNLSSAAPSAAQQPSSCAC